MFTKIAVSLYVAATFAIAYLAIGEVRNAQAASVPQGADCHGSGAGAPSMVGRDAFDDSVELPRQLGAELEQVHNQWNRTCVTHWKRITERRWICRRTRINEGGGHTSYYETCGYRNVTVRHIPIRSCYSEWRVHWHTMLPLDPSRPTIPLV